MSNAFVKKYYTFRPFLIILRWFNAGNVKKQMVIALFSILLNMDPVFYNFTLIFGVFNSLGGGGPTISLWDHYHTVKW
jgi:hypothetical protein